MGQNGMMNSLERKNGLLLLIAARFLPFLPAGDTPAMMDVDHPATGPACPALPLIGDKLPDPMVPDLLEVPDNAHVIPCPVPLVHQPDPFTGIIGTGRAASPPYMLAGEDETLPPLDPFR